jgi:hypothetical protein
MQMHAKDQHNMCGVSGSENMWVLAEGVGVLCIVLCVYGKEEEALKVMLAEWGGVTVEV